MIINRETKSKIIIFVLLWFSMCLCIHCKSNISKRKPVKKVTIFKHITFDIYKKVPVQKTYHKILQLKVNLFLFRRRPPKLTSQFEYQNNHHLLEERFRRHLYP